MNVYGYIDIPLWMITLLCAVILFYFYGAYPLRADKRLGIPGPGGVPFFGTALKLMGESDKFYAHINKWKEQFGRIYCIIAFREPILIVTDPEALRQIFVKDFNHFTDRHFVGYGNLVSTMILKSLFFAEGTDWQRIRRITTPLFSGARIKLLFDHINRTAKQLADNLVRSTREGVQPEAKKIFAAYSLDFLTGSAFGVQLDTLNNPNNDLMRATRELLGINSFLTTLKIFLACTFPVIGKIFKLLGIGLFGRGAVDYFVSFADRQVKDRKKHPETFKQADFMQFLMNAEADPSDDIVGGRKLTQDEIAAQGLVFMIAGYESMSTSLQFLTYELGLNQGIQTKVVAEINRVVGTAEEPTYEQYTHLKYLEAVINETIRMYPPIHLISRKTMIATDVKGFHIPANTGIFVPILSLSRDPEFFEDPLRFDPERFVGENKNAIDQATLMTFGLGPRQCVGMRLSMFAMKAAIVHMFRKVTVVDASPRTLVIDDNTPMLVPQIPIKLHLETKD